MCYWVFFFGWFARFGWFVVSGGLGGLDVLGGLGGLLFRMFGFVFLDVLSLFFPPSKLFLLILQEFERKRKKKH
jgi:hypothetical protein